MKNLIILIILCLLTNNIAAHNGTIEITVLDSKSMLAIENANLLIHELQSTASTNAFGKLKLSDIKAQKLQLTVTCIGYQTKSIIVEINYYETTLTKILLTPKKAQLEEVKINGTPKASFDLLNKVDLNTRFVNNSQDILKIVPGLFIAQHAGGGKAEQIFLRGFDCDHGTDIALSVDGMPVNMVSHAHGQGYADLHFVIPETIEKVNVRKGPYNASIGDFSTAGAIQFVTKNSFEKNTIGIEKGFFNNTRMSLTTNLLTAKLSPIKSNLIFAGEYNFNNSYFDRPSKLNRINLFTKFIQQPNANNTLTISASYFNSFWNASGQIPLRLVQNNTISHFGSVDTTESGATSRTNISVSILSGTKKGSIIKNQIFYNKYAFNLYSNFTFFKNDTINGDAIKQTEQRDIFGYNGSYTNTQSFWGVKLNTTIGAMARLDNISNIELSNVKQQTIILKRMALGNIQQLNTGVFLDEQMALTKKLHVNLGIRLDAFSFKYTDLLSTNTTSHNKRIIKSILSPKANVFYNYNKQVQIYLQSGKSFHSNDARVVIAQNGYEILPAAYGSEIGVNLKPNKNIWINTALWQLKSNQEFVYVGDESIVEQSGASSRIGIDWSLRYQLRDNLYLDCDINYTLSKSINEAKNQNFIPLAPKFTSIGGVTYEPIKKLQTALRYRHIGDRAANEDNSVVAKGYTLLDANVNYTIKHFAFGIYAENLLNTTWREAQFNTETKLKNEAKPVSEIHFTGGTPLNVKAKIAYNF
jgi:outer membrane receptor protein involved in Fe transport